MEMADLLSEDAVFISVDGHSKKHALQEISAQAAKVSGLQERAIFETLNKRERLGSTGVGNGIAIPHGKVVNLKTLSALFFRLAAPIDFDALDGEPVDLVFVLLAPEDAGADHLKALAKIARVLRAEGVAEDLRGAITRGDVFSVLTRAPANAG
ncbi:MAG: PTS IIA-like nitrogen regulatory protein PtsN [Pseudomonadota bacterium]